MMTSTGNRVGNFASMACLWCGTVWLACVTPTLGGPPTAYNQISTNAPNPYRSLISTVQGIVQYKLSYTDSLVPTNPTFILVTAPTNGILEYKTDFDGDRWLAVQVDVPVSNTAMARPDTLNSARINNNKWAYTCTNNLMSAVGSVDTFTWKAANNMGTSGVATCTIRIGTNSPPTAMDVYRACVPDTDTTFAVEFYDPDNIDLRNCGYPCGQTWNIKVVAAPTNGSFVATNGLFLTYRPNPGTSHSFDRFTYKINDTMDDSANTATGVIQIRSFNDRAGNLVILVADGTTMSGTLTSEVCRLRNDLLNEGYACKIKSWPDSGTTASNVWDYLRSEYTNTSQFLAGAVLIGNKIPMPTVYTAVYTANDYPTDLPYWNMNYFETNQPIVNPNHLHDIWVSRIAYDPWTEKFGDTTTLLRRAFDANHDYRTGASRYPHSAFGYCNPKFYGAGPAFGSGCTNQMKEVWQDVGFRGGTNANGWDCPSDPAYHFLPIRPDTTNYLAADCMILGGELFESVSDGGSYEFMGFEGRFTDYDVFRIGNQIRFQIVYACDSAYERGGIVGGMLLTRGGGGVIALGTTKTLGGAALAGGQGTYTITECTLTDTHFRRLLKGGESWGSAAVQYFAFNDRMSNPMLTIYGDLSLPVMASPANSLPVIDNYTVSVSACHSPVQVRCAVNACDPDGTISNIEWFLTGYDYGRAAPTFSGTGTSVLWLCSTPGTYTTRVEVVDNYKARAWQESVIVVTAPTACTVTALSGLGGSVTPSGDVVLAIGSTTSITSTPAQWYSMASLEVDGANVGTPPVFTFNNVTNDHTLLARFVPDLAPSNTPYWWMAQYHLTNGGLTFAEAETNDADGDGMTACQEFVAGTDPTNRSSALLLGTILSNGQHLVTWSTTVPTAQYGATNRTYALENRTNMLVDPWTPIPNWTNIQAHGQTVTYTNQTGAANLFIRCKVWLGL